MSVKTNGRVRIKFGEMKNRLPFDTDEKRSEFLRRLNEIPRVNLPPVSINKFPAIFLSTLVDPSALEQFKQAVAWTIEEVKAAREKLPGTLLPQSARS